MEYGLEFEDIFGFTYNLRDEFFWIELLHLLSECFVLHTDQIFELTEIEEQVVVALAEVEGDLCQRSVLLFIQKEMQLIDLGIMLQKCFIKVFLDH